MKLLFVDIETSPIISYTWGLHEQNVGLNQIKKDWHLLSWSAKWAGEKEVMYMDQSKAKDVANDKALLEGIWKLLDAADIVVGQNSVSFDIKKLNARFIQHGMKPPSSFQQIDTLKLAKKYFGFTSNKLEYLSKNLCSKYKKHAHKKFPGFELWLACLAGNKEAWKEMKTYNMLDVLSLEELYNKLIAWDNNNRKVNFDVYHENLNNKCKCGCTKFNKSGYAYTATGKFQRYVCYSCGAETRDKENLLSTEKKKSLRT